MSVRDLVGRTLAGWQLLSLLGQGGMGAVFRAKNLATGHEGAFKLVLAPSSASQAAARLKRETELLSRLSHPGLVRVLGSGVLPDGRPWYVMELVPGRALDAIVEEEAPFEARRAARIVAQAARALGHAHAQAIVHRDVKPSNIVVRPDGTAVVLDFGLAKAILEDEAERLSKTGQLMGTVHYMSPEQAVGKSSREIGPTSDVFSLGVVLYELLVGERPFSGATAIEVLARIGSAIATPVRERVPAVPRALDAIVTKALTREPALRYPDGTALALDLERFLEGKEVTARPGRGSARGAKRALIAVGVLAALVGVAATLVHLARTSPATGPGAPGTGDVHAAAVSLQARARELATGARLADRSARPLATRTAPLEDLVRSGEALAAKLPTGDPWRPELIRALVVARATLLALRPPSDAVLAEVDAAAAELAGAPEPALLSAVRGLALEGRGKAADAVPALERAVAATGTDRELVLDLFPAPRLEEALAGQLLEGGRAADAAALLDRVIARGREGDRSIAGARRRLLRARARQALHEYEHAVADVEAAEATLAVADPRAARDRGFAISFVEKGRALLAAGKDEESARAFLEAGARDSTAFPRDVALSAAAVLERVATEAIRHMNQATSPGDRPTPDRVRAQHAALDLALALDPAREKAPPGLVYLEKVLCQTAEAINGVRFLVAARFRRLGVPFDAKEDLFMMRASDGAWGRNEKELREVLATDPGNSGKVAYAYLKFSEDVRQVAPDAALEAEEEWRAVVPDELLDKWFRARARTLLALRRTEEGLRHLDQAVESARALPDRHRLADALFWRGTSHKDTGRFAEGLRDLDETIRIYDEIGDAPNGFPWFDRAHCLHGLHRDDEALAALETARKRGGVDETSALGPLEAVIQEALSKKRGR